jgi:hypothetical protein
MKKKRGKPISPGRRNSGSVRGTPSKRRFGWQVMGVTCAFVVIGAIIVEIFHSRFSQPEFHKPRTFAELISLPTNQLDQVDIGLMDLLCAQGLKGAEDMDVTQCVQTLDSWAQLIEETTQRNLYRYYKNPAEFDNSQAEFRILLLSTILKRDLGVQYDPRFRDAPIDDTNDGTFYQDAKDCFVNGAVSEERIGTCATLPVLYVAVGRRLGYPLKLVSTRGHFFLRWDDGKERFDIEATSSGGCNFYTDDHYKEWPFHLSEEEIRENGYLQDMSPADELAAFIEMRSCNLMSNQAFDDSLEMLPLELRLAPHCRGYRDQASIGLHLIEGELVDYPQNFREGLPALRQQYGTNSPEEAHCWDEYKQHMQRLEKTKIALVALGTHNKPD